MATIDVIDGIGAHVALEKPLAAGQAAMAASRPVVIASDQTTVPVSLASVPSHAVTNAGTFAVQAASTLAAETTKVIGTVNISAAQPITPVDQYGTHKEAPASATTLLGATGAVGDYLAGVVIIPGTAAAGTVGMTDGNGSTISLFAGGGTTPLPSLVPFFVPLGIFAVNATTAGWRLILGANVTAIGVGKFT